MGTIAGRFRACERPDLRRAGMSRVLPESQPSGRLAAPPLAAVSRRAPRRGRVRQRRGNCGWSRVALHMSAGLGAKKQAKTGARGLSLRGAHHISLGVGDPEVGHDGAGVLGDLGHRGGGGRLHLVGWRGGDRLRRNQLRFRQWPMVMRVLGVRLRVSCKWVGSSGTLKRGCYPTESDMDLMEYQPTSEAVDLIPYVLQFYSLYFQLSLKLFLN